MHNSKSNNEYGKNEGDEAIEQVRLTRLAPSSSSNATSLDNIHEDYQNAVDRLIECECILTSLQNQLASKDLQIKSLEERLVAMSVELASSKALEDEHRLLKRQMDAMNETMKSFSNRSNSGGLDTDFPPSPRINKQQQQQQLQRAQSLKLESTPDASADASRAPFIKAARRNTAIDTTTYHRKPLRHFSAGTLMMRRTKCIIRHRSPIKNKRSGSRGSISSALEIQRSNINSTRSSRPLLTNQVASRRFSDIGAYLLGRGRNNKDAVEIGNDSRHRHDLPRKRSRSNRLESSTGSLISAVVFPATSREVLASCLDGEAWRNNANAVWADF